MPDGGSGAIENLDRPKGLERKRLPPCGMMLRFVGASISGCAAAILFGRKGARVALVERAQDPAAYKKVCTHYIQPSATPTIERLGLATAIEMAGGLRNEVELFTRWGWVLPPRTPLTGRPAYGYNIRRQMLDPIVRNLLLKSGSRSQIWFLEPDIAYAFPNDGAKLAKRKADPEAAMQRLFDSLPNGPELGRAERVSPMMGVVEYPNLISEGIQTRLSADWRRGTFPRSIVGRLPHVLRRPLLSTRGRPWDRGK